MNGETNLIYDTSALVVFSSQFVSDNTRNLIPSVVVLELTSKMRRLGKDPKKFIDFLRHNGTILSLDAQTTSQAGELHAKLKKKDKDISVPDCIIMAHGNNHNALILTKDKHFKYYNKVKFI